MRVATGTDLLLADVEGGIATMTFNDPARHNVLSGTMQAAIVPLVEAWEADDTVRVVVMSGAGERSFAAGADIGELVGPSASREDTATAWSCWGGLTKPVVAKIDGYCIGGGLLMALQADIRICSDRSTFAIPPARLGLGYGSGGVRAVMQVVGPSVTADLLFSARQFTAQEALVAGLVNRVVAHTDLDTVVSNAVGQIAANAPLTVRTCKVAIRMERQGGDASIVESMVAACFASQDFVEGRAAFREKREPVFRGM